MKYIRVTYVRKTFQDVLDRVYYTEECVVITKRGKPWVCVRPLTDEEKEKK